MVTQTKRFKAAAAGAPVSNMISAYDGIRWGTGLPRQFQYERTQSRIGGTLWEYPHALHRELADLHGRPRADAADDAAQRPGRRGAVVSGHRVLPGPAPARQGSAICSTTSASRTACARRRTRRTTRCGCSSSSTTTCKGAPKPEWMEKGIPYKPREGSRPTAPRPPEITEGNE